MHKLSRNLLVLSFLVVAVMLVGCSQARLDIVITGVENGGVYASAVTPVVGVEAEGASVTTTLNGAAYDGSAISADGVYVLNVEASLEQQTASKSVTFSIKQGATNYTVLDGFTQLDGFSKENDAELSLNSNPDYIIAGTGSLRVDKGPSDARSMVRMRDYHQNFRTDLSAYNRFAVWFYVDDPALLRADHALAICFWTAPGKPAKVYTADMLVSGWNYLEVDLTDSDLNLDRSSLSIIEFQLRTADAATPLTFYYDEIAVWTQK